MKRKLSIDEIINFLDEEKSQFDKNYDTLTHLSYDKPRSNSMQKLGISIRCNPESGVYLNEKAAKALRCVRREVRKLNYFMEEFFDEYE